MPRMRILSANEQVAFDKPPLFDHRDRKKFFDFPKSLLKIADGMRNSNTEPPPAEAGGINRNS
jgi:hypothetical protein